MPSLRRVALCLTAVALLSVAVAPPAGAAVANGGFEAPTAPVGGFQRLAAGSALGAWTVTANDVDLSGVGFWQTAEGGQALDLEGGSGFGAVSQSIATAPVRTAFRVRFALAGNPLGGPAVKTLRVLVDGQAVGDFSFDTTGRSPSDMGYAQREVSFTSTRLVTTLTFASTTGSGYGPVVDDVRVAPRCPGLVCP
ncbi:choice-of-anchor C family protein [Actinosynnema sp. NPDC053489]|uniref:choice-of-anchor C family protein n=1 Tax=Actinosynnema sp. NPDC053489 TaxID=3363916 RepID=UPI0037C77D27